MQDLYWLRQCALRPILVVFNHVSKHNGSIFIVGVTNEGMEEIIMYLDTKGCPEILREEP
jgi:hypothetical protein